MRDYDPTTGRYLQADPLGLIDGASVYGYVKQSPMRFIDPTGEFIPAAVWGAVRLAAIAYTLYELYCAETWEDYLRIVLDNMNPGKKLCPVCRGFGPGGPSPNGGGGPRHGGPNHDQAINDLVEDLKKDPSVSDIRKNQRQVDVDGNTVGTNLPDVQYNKDGCHVCVEFDNSKRRSQRHGETIRNNDPKAKIILKLL